MSKVDDLLKIMAQIQSMQAPPPPSHCHDGCPPSAPVKAQYEQTLARFNDSSSQNVAQMQSAATQLYQTWGAHMLKLQADITSGNQ